jgi:predicted Co/Zn/Cd cation transporter (cation efflux family)
LSLMFNLVVLCLFAFLLAMAVLLGGNREFKLSRASMLVLVASGCMRIIPGVKMRVRGFVIRCKWLNFFLG